MQTRLSRTAEKRTKKQLFLSLIGIVVVLFVLFKFGIPVLTNISLFLSSKNSSQQVTTTPKGVVAQPVLSMPYTATNSATITVAGTAGSKQLIQLYVNDSLTDTTTAKNDGTFTFASVTLTQQQNTIQAKAKQDNKMSDFSDTWNVSYIQKAPSLSVSSPQDKQTFPKDQSIIPVKGKTDPDARITVNGLWAIVDSLGNYSYNFPLKNGDNQITVVATDAAGNTTTKQLTVKYSQ